MKRNSFGSGARHAEKVLVTQLDSTPLFGLAFSSAGGTIRSGGGYIFEEVRLATPTASQISGCTGAYYGLRCC
jgi:hypothetical protein